GVTATSTANGTFVSVGVAFEPVRRMQVRSPRRREFVAILGGAAAWPRARHAQRPQRMRRVGVLMQWSGNDPRSRASAADLGKALADFGWVEGKSIRIDYRFAAGGNPTLFKTYAVELVELLPDVILAASTPGLAAVREQTRTIPIVFV